MDFDFDHHRRLGGFGSMDHSADDLWLFNTLTAARPLLTGASNDVIR